MARFATKGKCNLCGREFANAGMTKHLQTCWQRNKLETNAGTSLFEAKLFHVVATGGYYYWMHLQIPAKKKLADLDHFLRQTWLECCDHLSAFEIDGIDYTCSNSAFGIKSRSMNFELGRVLRPGVSFQHQYDFGSTTKLSLKVVAEQKSPTNGKIAMLARNQAPEISCASCDEIATQICMDCDDWLCEQCAAKHGGDEDRRLPVVNSPRTGVCGYCG